MIGVVLSGGQSSRMGSDKGLLSHDGKLWAAIAADKLCSLGILTGIAINASQKAQYEKHLANQLFFTDNAVLEVYGPLLGLLSVHELHPDEDLFLLACDLLQMDHQMLGQIDQFSLRNPDHEAFICVNNNEPEPLCGIYTSKGLKKIKALLDAGELTRHSMKYVLSKLSVFEILLNAQEETYFKNFNDPAAIHRDR